jgi:uncharacterized protein (TIGR02186 family)
VLRLAALLLLLAGPLAAQETVVTGVSTDNIALNATFDGSELFVFGAIRRDAPPPPGARSPGIVITIKGPPRQVRVRRKERRFGIWINTESVRVRQAPSFYAIATTGELDQMLSETERLRYGIGMDQAVRRVAGNEDVADTSTFTDALVRLRMAKGIYQVLEGEIAVAQDTLFQTRIDMPANLVEGDYAAEFFLVRDREVISSGGTTIRVEKTGVERWLFNLAKNSPLLYGLMYVALALAAGWMAAEGFRLAKR